MNSSQFLSILRTALKVLGSALATHGAQKAAALINSEDVIGLVLLIGGVWWSHCNHAPTDDSELDICPDQPAAKAAVTDRTLQPDPSDLTKL